ncbi:MAG: four helix bundle protein [bacterium]
MKTFRFLEFKVYNDAKQYLNKIIIISEKVHSHAFKDQIRRAALSVILNIAEGSAKKSDKEFARFLEIAIGSVNEVVACTDILYNLKKIDKKEFDGLLAFSEEIVKQLGGFIKKLKVNC